MIQFQNVKKQFKNGTVALEDINLTIRDGEFVYIVGMSGAGKSTLIKLLLKEYDVSAGHITVDGLRLDQIPRWKIPAYRRNIGFVFQNFRLLSDRTAYENVAFACECMGLSSREVRRKSREALQFVGLRDRMRHRPDELSAGEQQRVSIARAVINNPRIVICDEPTGNLDHQTAAGIMQLMENIHQTGATVLMATHDRRLMDNHIHRVVSLADGHIVGDTRPTTRGLRHEVD